MAKLSVQLWSLKDETKKDFRGVLKKVSELGYDGVEFAGFGGIEAEEMKELLEKNGLEVSGAHIGLEELEKNLNEIIQYNKIIGNKYIVCPYADVKTAEDCADVHKRLAAVAVKLAENGIITGYHNHGHEFIKFGDKYANDIIVGDDNKLIYEVDIFWTTYAKVDTVEYLKKLEKRCPLLHMKDMRIDSCGNKKDATFGEGIVKSAEILDAAFEYCDPEWLVIEWEAFGETDAFEAVGKGLENLKNILAKL